MKKLSDNEKKALFLLGMLVVFEAVVLCVRSGIFDKKSEDGFSRKKRKKEREVFMEEFFPQEEFEICDRLTELGYEEVVVMIGSPNEVIPEYHSTIALKSDTLDKEKAEELKLVACEVFDKLNSRDVSFYVKNTGKWF